MRVAVLGATGNIGTSVSDLLSCDPEVDEVVRVARRHPGESLLANQQFRSADVTHDDLRPILAGCDAVVHSAWAIHPMRRPTATWETNVAGTRNVLRCVIDANVGSMIYLSSVGAYAPRVGDAPVDEHWPIVGLAHLAYAREKAVIEGLLDRAAQTSSLRIVKLRPTVVLKGEAASQFEHYFLGVALAAALRKVPRRFRAIPLPDQMWVQAVHTTDVAEAVRLSLFSEASGAFNLAAPDPLDRRRIAQAIGGPSLPVPATVAVAAAGLGFHSRLVPASPGWLEMALRAPVLDCSKATDQLGWVPSVTAADALQEVVHGIELRSGRPTPPLA
jgi:UDP-glucose 4-epimerase